MPPKRRVHNFRESSKSSNTEKYSKGIWEVSTTSDSDDNCDKSRHVFASTTKRANHNIIRRLRHRNSTLHTTERQQRRRRKERKSITELSQLSRTECRNNIMTALSKLHEVVHGTNAEKSQEWCNIQSTGNLCISIENNEEECKANMTPTITLSQTNSNTNSESGTNDAAADDDDDDYQYNNLYHSVPIPVHVFDQPGVQMCYALHTRCIIVSESVEENIKNRESKNFAFILSNGTCGIFFTADHSCIQLLHFSINKKEQTCYDNNSSPNSSGNYSSITELCQQQQEKYENKQEQKQQLLLLMYVDGSGKAFIVSPCALEKIEMRQEKEANQKEERECYKIQTNNERKNEVRNSIETRANNCKPCDYPTNVKEISWKSQPREEHKREYCITEAEVILNNKVNNTSYFIIPSILEQKFMMLAQALPVLNKHNKETYEYNITNDKSNIEENEKITNNLLVCRNVHVQLEPTRWQSSILLCEEFTRKAISAAYTKSKSVLEAESSSSSFAEWQIHYRVHNLGFGEVVRVEDRCGNTSDCAINSKLRYSYQFSSPRSLWRIPYVALVTLNELNSCSISDIDVNNNDNNKGKVCKYTFTLANKLTEFT